MGDGSVYEAFAAHQYDEAVSLATRCLFGSDNPLPLAPLYFAPTLTDAEREALEAAVGEFSGLADEFDALKDAKRAVTLRGLLERLK